MYWTMLRREMLGRKRQTAIVAAGLAIAVALVIVVSSLSAGIRGAQTEALENVYGVGTDLTVSGAPADPGTDGGPRFDFGQGEGQTSDGTTRIDQSRLGVQPGRGTLDADSVQTIAALDGVAATTGVLSLTNTTFSGEMPDFSQMGGDLAEPAAPPGGGSDGAGGSSFGLDSFTVLGVDPGTSEVGPLSATALSDGRLFDAGDQNGNVALLDGGYASTAGLAVGDTVEVGGESLSVVGVLVSATDEADTAADVYLPIDTARELAGLDEVVSSVYVSADSAADISSVQQRVEEALPDATVSSQADLAAQVSGSLTSAASLISSLGTWLSAIVLVVALAIAMLLTGSGVARRTREFGTLKAIGWSNRRVVSQLAGESALQALMGGAAGLILGLGAIAVVNVASLTIGGSGSGASPNGMPDGMAGAGPGGQEMDGAAAAGMPSMPGGMGGFSSQSAAEIVLHAPVTLWVVVAAVGLSLLGGLVAGSFGAWRAARLSPAEALRTVA